jgi:hypothetical protein
MDAEQIQKYKAFVNDAWDKAVNHKEGEFIPKDEFVLFVDKSGYRHAITTQRIRHIYRQHGNERAEKSRGQIAITQKDLELIPDIIDNYSFAIKNFTFEGNKAIFYAKHGHENTFVFIETISNRREKNSAATFYNLSKIKSANDLLEILESNPHADVSEVEIVGPGGGGNPTSKTQTESRMTVASPVSPANLSSISPDSAGKSSSASGGG